MFRRLTGYTRVAAGVRFRGVPDETAELDPLGATAAEDPPRGRSGFSGEPGKRLTGRAVSSGKHINLLGREVSSGKHITHFLVVNITQKFTIYLAIFSCDFLKISVALFELQAYNNIKDKGNNKFPISQINQLF